MIKSTVPAQVQTSDRPEEGGKVSFNETRWFVNQDSLD